jgi:hypothetical protein
MATDLEGQIRELIDRGARPVSFLEVSQRPAARRPAGRRRPVLTVAASGLAAAACAVGLAIAHAYPGQTPSSAPSAAVSQGSAVLTAATVRHVASASGAALASSGQERISYESIKNGTVTSSGTDTVMYQGSDWSYAVHTAVPSYPDGETRVVNGQFYLKSGPGPWLHEGGLSPAPHFPEATTLLRLLSPAASFQDAGTAVIDGVRLTHLHATRLSGLPDDPTLARYANLLSKAAVAPPGTLTALDVWADSHGVVRQMRIQLDGGDGHTILTVAFTGFGQPQSITAPPVARPVHG